MRLCKAAYKASFGKGIRDKYRCGGMAKAPYLETLDSFLLTMLFEPLRMAHPDHPALHLRY
ncbi:MAG TPA: hypothetical protein EYN27_00130 [Rhodospirillales bacterium]|nr:hypothetical protein [Rhodospirillales bacterium]